MSSTQSQKGSRLEYKIRDQLTEHTGAKWERTPMSGGGVIKGDLFCPKNHYYYAFECKSFKDTVIMENLLWAKSNNFYGWWEQCVREAKHMDKIPALVFKKDRGKTLIALEEILEGEVECFHLNSNLGNEKVTVNIYLFETWLEHKLPEEIVLV